MKLTQKELVEFRGDLHFFILGYFKYFRQTGFVDNWHFRLLADVLMRVVAGKILRLIINIPPRYGKTEYLIGFMAWVLGLFPDSEFIYASYAAELAAEKSSICRELVSSDFYKAVFPGVEISPLKGARKHWLTNFGGQVYSSGSDGTITGFGAGKKREGFGGGLIIDDPHKPNEALSEVKRSKVLGWYKNTAVNRLNKKDTPVIIIMQRLHDSDLAGWLLDNGYGDASEWTVVKIPALGKGDAVLWPWMHDLPALRKMELNDQYNFSSQFQQDPSPAGGSIFKKNWWQFYEGAPPTPDYKFITADTAQKTKTHNHYSVLQCWGKRKRNLYMIDQERGKWEAPELRVNFVAFWNKHLHNPGALHAPLIRAYVEDKSSGTGLIQDVSADGKIPITPIQRHEDKVTRALDVAPHIKQGYVYLPIDAPWVADYMREFVRFSPLGTHDFDDQVDATIDAISQELVTPTLQIGLW